MILLDAPPSGDYFLQLFAAENLAPSVKYRCPSYELVRGLVGQGLGYSILATKPASNLSYDGHALITRPLPPDTRASRTVIATKAGTDLPTAAEPFIKTCQGLFS